MNFTRFLTVTDSSQIREIYYSVQNRAMEVVFSNGAVYGYKNVTDKTFGALASSDSVGKYFAQYIRPFSKGTKVL